ncbi:MAG: phosphoglucosamine mutase [Pseudomonadota bacterium]
MPAPIRFGTDGLRGPAHAWPLDADGARTVGLGLARQLQPAHPAAPARVLLGRDTRESGPLLVAALAEGLAAGGAAPIDAGVLPTAGLSALCVARGAAAALMVTASHNPWTDNGVKVLGPDGRKYDHAAALEAIFDALLGQGGPPAAAGAAPVVVVDPDPLGPWRDALPWPRLDGLRLLLDAAHGAAWSCAPAALEARGATVVRRGCAPTGRDINAGVGALHPPSPAEVRAAGCALAICLDGDADRVVLVDPVAGQLDGDDLLWLLCRDSGAPVGGTIMCNGGLEAALGGRLRRSAVGDQPLWREMVASGAPVGAEPSGHVLFTDGMPTGDGLYAALRVLAAVAGPGGAPRLPLPVGGWTRWAQASRTLPAGRRPPLSALASVAAAEAAGMRTVVRYSGTEPILRVQVEGPQAPEPWAEAIAAEFLRLAAEGT